jgi:hypothetical protein
VDVPNLIAEAKQSLRDEGYDHVSILTSPALGTQLEFMLGGVNDLVEMALLKNG